MKTKTIGSRIREARIARGMTQKQLAEAIPVTNAAYVCRIESGGSVPSADIIRRVCIILKVSADSLFGLPEAREACRH